MNPIGAEVQASGCVATWIETAKKQTNTHRRPDKATERMQTDEQTSVQKKKAKTRTGTDRKTQGPEPTGTRPEHDRNDEPGTDRKRIPGPGPEDRNRTGTRKTTGPERDRNT